MRLVLATCLAFLLVPGCLELAATPERAAEPAPETEEAPDLAEADAGSPPDPPAAEGDSRPAPPPPSPPPPMHWEAGFTVGADVGTVVMGTPCGDLSSCDKRSFTTRGTFGLEATLAWGVPANDFDLYLFQGGAEVSHAGMEAAVGPPGTTQVLVHEGLPPGDYELWVVGSLMVKDTYRLDAVFSLPPNP